MAQISSRLAELRSRLETALRGKSGVDIRLLPENQMQISYKLTKLSDLSRGKRESETPGKAGYKVYVACRTQEEYAAEIGVSQRVLGPAARPIAWDPGSMKLELTSGSTGSEWTLINAEGNVVRINVDCGSNEAVPDVNRILSEIQGSLLS
jgi:hypothetical protein